MSKPISDPKDLKKALDNNQNTIEIEGNLADRTVTIKATGKVAWVVALGAVTVAIGATFITPAAPIVAPVTTITAGITAPVAVATVGTGTTVVMISLAITTGSLAAAKLLFKKLRNDYIITEKRKGYVVLKRK